MTKWDSKYETKETAYRFSEYDIHERKMAKKKLYATGWIKILFLHKTNENADNKANENIMQNHNRFSFQLEFFLKRQNSPDYFLHCDDYNDDDEENDDENDCTKCK